MKRYEEKFGKILQRIEKARIETNEYNIVNIIFGRFTNTVAFYRSITKK